jgi:hypothetical protein
MKVIKLLGPERLVISGGAADGVCRGQFLHWFPGLADDREGLFYPGEPKSYLGDLPTGVLQVFDQREHFSIVGIVNRYQEREAKVGDLVKEMPDGAPYF